MSVLILENGSVIHKRRFTTLRKTDVVSGPPPRNVHRSRHIPTLKQGEHFAFVQSYPIDINLGPITIGVKGDDAEAVKRDVDKIHSEILSLMCSRKVVDMRELDLECDVTCNEPAENEGE